VCFFSGFSIAMGQQVSDLPTLFCQQGSNGEREKKGIAEDGVVSQSCHGKHSLHWSLMPSLCSCIFYVRQSRRTDAIASYSQFHNPTNKGD